MTMPLGIYGITSDRVGSHYEAARLLVEGGIDLIQYRNKEASEEVLIEEASQIKELCRKNGRVFIVNDNVRVAKAVDADGVHLGQKDISLSEARSIAGGWLDGKIIGISVMSVIQALEAEKAGATYLGAGPVFPTTTKLDEEHIGLKKLGRIRQSVSIPVFAIGGLNSEHIPLMKEMGINGIAVISAILSHQEPITAAKELRRLWES